MSPEVKEAYKHFRRARRELVALEEEIRRIEQERNELAEQQRRLTLRRTAAQENYDAADRSFRDAIATDTTEDA